VRSTCSRYAFTLAAAVPATTKSSSPPARKIGKTKKTRLVNSMMAVTGSELGDARLPHADRAVANGVQSSVRHVRNQFILTLKTFQEAQYTQYFRRQYTQTVQQKTVHTREVPLRRSTESSSGPIASPRAL